MDQREKTADRQSVSASESVRMKYVPRERQEQIKRPTTTTTMTATTASIADIAICQLKRDEQPVCLLMGKNESEREYMRERDWPLQK